MRNNIDLKEVIGVLESGKTLSKDVMSCVFRIIVGGEADDDFVRDFLTLLAQRIPTGDELYGATVVMKEHVDRVQLHNPENLLDTCGTGGAPKTFNVSTGAGIVAAACGVRVAKHGNRSRTGRGSAEVLEALGINIHASSELQALCLQEVGICFSFAPNHHQAVAHVMPVRKSLSFPTIFNLVGPLTNPCNAGRQLLGVWDEKYLHAMAESLQLGGCVHGAVVHSEDGLDEISVSAPTRIIFVDQESITEQRIQPEDFGLSVWAYEDVIANSLDHAVAMLQEIFQGVLGGPRDMVLMNTGVGLYVSGQCQSVHGGIKAASQAIDSGACLQLLESWRTISNNTPSTEQ